MEKESKRLAAARKEHERSGRMIQSTSRRVDVALKALFEAMQMQQIARDRYEATARKLCRTPGYRS